MLSLFFIFWLLIMGWERVEEDMLFVKVLVVFVVMRVYRNVFMMIGEIGN